MFKNNTQYIYGDEVIIQSQGKCYGQSGVVIGDWKQEGYINCYKVRVENINKTICVKENNLIKKGDKFMASKLKGYKQVAKIKMGGCSYYYAIFDDGRKYQIGDKVIVSGVARNEVHTIHDIITPEEAAQIMGNKNITAEVIGYVDTTAYDERVSKRKQAESLKKKMDNMIKEIDETNKYEMYAERNPELKDLLDSYKSLIS